MSAIQSKSLSCSFSFLGSKEDKPDKFPIPIYILIAFLGAVVIAVIVAILLIRRIRSFSFFICFAKSIFII